jgi:hypothetical protein
MTGAGSTVAGGSSLWPATSELHGVFDVAAEELRFTFEGGTPTELSVARSGTLVHHEQQLYGPKSGDEAFEDSYSCGPARSLLVRRICAECRATILR